MHADLLGIMKHLWSIWNDSYSPICLTNNDVIQINNRLLKMTPPQEIHRLVRSIKSENCKWKASEWRSFLLFYAIPCLKGILRNDALLHLALLSNSIYTLLQTRISEEELNKCESDLTNFIGCFEILYGPRYVTFNVHSLKHLVKCVRYCGPLWCTSTFSFENAIFYLKRCVHEPKGIYEQMTKNTIRIQSYKTIVQEVSETAACSLYCNSLF